MKSQHKKFEGIGLVDAAALVGETCVGMVGGV